jgi:hypothetical protein
MTLSVTGSDIVHMETGTYMWVQLTHFTIEANQDDHLLPSALIASPGYAHDYASPFDAETTPDEPAIHGRWWRSELHPDLFHPCTPGEAKAAIQAWAAAPFVEEHAFKPSPEIQRGLEAVYALLDSGRVYRLSNPGKEAEHEYGFVTGGMGFHEFVVIDERTSTAHVVVASDD